MTLNDIAQVYWGTRQAMLAECASSLDIYEGRYILVAEAPDGTWFTPEGFSTKKDARDALKELREYAIDPKFPACFVG